MFKLKRPPIMRLTPKQKAVYASNTKLTECDVRVIRSMYQSGASKADLSRWFGVVPTAITRVLTEESYSWVR